MMLSRLLAVQALLQTSVAAFVPKNANPSFLLRQRHTHIHTSNGNHHHHHHPSMAHRHRKCYISANRNDFDDSFGGGFFDDEFNRITGTGFQFIFDVDDDMKPEDVHIILFNPDTDREGVHTIEFPKESGNNMILAFESKLECEEFSASLKKQQFFDPTPQETKLEALENYCAQIGVEVQVVPEGMNLTPPKESVLNLGLNPDLEKEMKMLDYLFHISSSGKDGDGFDDFDDEDEYGAWE